MHSICTHTTITQKKPIASTAYFDFNQGVPHLSPPTAAIGPSRPLQPKCGDSRYR